MWLHGASKDDFASDLRRIDRLATRYLRFFPIVDGDSRSLGVTIRSKLQGIPFRTGEITKGCHDEARSATRVGYAVVNGTSICGYMIDSPSKERELVAQHLGQGLLCFDVDKTLLSSHHSLDDETFYPLCSKLIDLLEKGVPISFISGNFSGAQFRNILKPLLNAHKDQSSMKPLTGVDLFASTGSVHVIFDPGQCRFILDPKFDLRDVADDELIDERAIDRLTSDDGKGLRSCVRHWLSSKLQEHAIVGPTQYDTARLFETVQHADFARGAEEYKPKDLDQEPAWLVVRDRRSIVLKLEGFKNAETGLPHDKEKDARLFRKDLVDFLNDKAIKEELYRPFRFTKAGNTSIAITFRRVTKAAAAQYRMSRQPSPVAPRDFIYFGDEFNLQGNDYDLRDILLHEATLVHVGAQPAAAPIGDRYHINPGCGLINDGTMPSRDPRLMMLFDGPDGPEITRFGRRNPRRSYFAGNAVLWQAALRRLPVSGGG